MSERNLNQGVINQSLPTQQNLPQVIENQSLQGQQPLVSGQHPIVNQQPFGVQPQVIQQPFGVQPQVIQQPFGVQPQVIQQPPIVIQQPMHTEPIVMSPNLMGQSSPTYNMSTQPSDFFNVNHNLSCCGSQPCSPAEDAEIIFNSISGKFLKKNDNQSLISVIGRRTNAHMQRVRAEYEKLYQVDLLKDIDKNVHFKFKKLLVGLVKSYPEYRGEEVYRATKGLMTDKWALIDFIIGNDTRSVEEFKQFFRQKYEISLVDFIKSETKGDFETILVRAADARRSNVVQHDKIDSDTDILYQAGQGKFGTSEETFSEILTTRSYEHLAFVSARYKQRYDTSLKKAIKKETSSWFRTALLACFDPPALHWAKRMRDAVKGFGTDDSLIVNCFSQCTKPFLQEISLAYSKKYNRSLLDDIKGDTSGDYRELLLTLLDFPENERVQYNYQL